MHRQKTAGKTGDNPEKNFPVSSRLGDNGLYLPSGSGLEEEDLEEVCRAIEGIVRSP